MNYCKIRCKSLVNSKKTVDSEMNYYSSTPFSFLPLDKKAIDIHSRMPVPGAKEYLKK